MATLDLTIIKLGDLVTSSKGAKTIPLTTTSGQPIYWLPDGEFVPCFEPSAFNDPEATRVNISLMTFPAIEARLQALDQYLHRALVKDSQKYFGQVLTEEQVKERMQPSVRCSDKGHRSWRLKMNIEGRAKCVCYDLDRQIRAPPQSWLDISLRPRVVVKGLWLMNKECGLIYKLQAAQICEVTKECPFI
jgi:hypothetical protein